ncbi:arsenite efflux transporter metallochaperone ArsD [Bacillus sp. B15-48]|uniref:arsenite efflux transporter metallochaperone ArsD n=1 Tax=Bacillus sp. B15-48 TaxID=1548601 RepID=UPI00193FA0AC|nr:arsenite efflux transporter metallochaperone ArsD [Bacillus sp. B15-48]MBM4760858.1 arsenite efflux transporter metallochaperone ArsD [Bacillus sp. B15-48]
MKKVEIFDPALCCPTGVCGPSVDPELTRMAAAVFRLEKKGLEITRYNLGNEPARFVENKEVNQVLQEKGPESLPITVLNGEVVMQGGYPSNEQLAEWFDVSIDDLKEQKASQKINLF